MEAEVGRCFETLDTNYFGMEVETLEQDEVAETFEEVDNLDEDFVAGTEVDIENSLDEQVETVEDVDGTGTVDHQHEMVENAADNLEKYFRFWILILDNLQWSWIGQLRCWNNPLFHILSQTVLLASSHQSSK